MKIRNVTMMVATALLVTSVPPAFADTAATKSKNSSSVQEMLQRRQESQLREQLVREGRTDELRALDDAIAQREKERRGNALAQLNQSITGVSAKANVPVTADSCDRDFGKVR
jgi:hypothetical protein